MTHWQVELNIDINDSLNIILMHKKIEDKYDNFDMTIMPDYKVR